jgi:hypothetical protein
MAKNIVPIQKADSDIVDGVIINPTPWKALYYAIKVLDFALVIAFFCVTMWLLKKGFNPMFGLLLFPVRFLWSRIDDMVCKNLGVERKRMGKK